MVLETKERFAVGTAFADKALLNLDYRADHARAKMALLVARDEAHIRPVIWRSTQMSS